MQPNSQVHYGYDALQLAACNIPPVPKSNNKPVLSENDALKNNKADITVYVDSSNGDDNNPDKPVKTVHHTVDLYRGQKTKLTDKGIIILAAGDYYLTNTVCWLSLDLVWRRVSLSDDLVLEPEMEM